ncbi:DUF4225 domain-containing protein [Affinibrenneria salicis]|uniref:DUF4225 domain-containing protein n=1 Tax=Affinibrenneria salicis TaxID=2590031 RepID=A0A5J5FZ69_9GAMM|nr:DUF4225 domain-containing protein [Affinibrenneria salicis]
MLYPYREDYVGPVRFVCRGIAREFFHASERNADVIYTSVDIAVSLNDRFGYKHLSRSGETVSLY